MSYNPRDPKEEARNLCFLHKTSASLEFDEWDRFHARATALAIIKSLYITIGHLELNKRDSIEATNDIQYWKNVEYEITSL